MDLSSIVNTSSNHNHPLWSTHATATATPADAAVKLYSLLDPPTHWTPASTSYRNRCPSHPSLPPNSPPLLLASDADECRSQSSKVFQFHVERSKALPTFGYTAAAAPTISSKPSRVRPRRQPTMPYDSNSRRSKMQKQHAPLPSPPISSPSSPASSTADHNDVTMMEATASPRRHPRTKQRPVRSIDPYATEGAFALCFGAAQVRSYAQQQMESSHSSRTNDDNEGDYDNDDNDSTSLMTGRSDTKNVGQRDDQQLHMTKATMSTHQDRHMKKAKTEAAVAYDSIDIHVPESHVFDPEWVPSADVFNDKPVRVVWKGTPLAIDKYEFFDQLHPGEVTIASTLRLLPEQYIRCKRILILAAQEAHKDNAPFRKSEAQKLCRIDVNKVSTLWSTFGKLGWLGAAWSGSR